MKKIVEQELAMGFNKLDLYTERCGYELALKVGDEALRGEIFLYGNYYLYVTPGKCEEIFNKQIDGTDVMSKLEYLYSLDFATYTLNAYKLTSKDKYKEFVENVIWQYFEKYNHVTVIDNLEEPELPIYAQVLLLVKYYSFFETLPNEKNIKRTLERYCTWLTKKENFISINNHGLFQILALLHLGIFLKEHPESDNWIKYAIDRLNEIVKIAYYPDGTNSEHSLNYYFYNNYLYGEIIDFCDHYNIKGIDNVKTIINKAKYNLNYFAYKDNSLPQIGDGGVNYADSSNKKSKYFPDLGVAVVKVGDFQLTFKIKTVWQAHAHIDISSITLRYKNLDLALDSGKQNYDKFSPVSRFERASTGHSAILPTKVDALFLGDVEERFSKMEMTEFLVEKEHAKLVGEYEFDGTKIKRIIEVYLNDVIIKDSWEGCNLINMRQRFVLPEDYIDKSSVSLANKKISISVDDTKIEYHISSDSPNSYTIPNFGMRSLKYGERVPTFLIDTFCENSKSGNIEARIGVK